jgi:hypothetical protein
LLSTELYGASIEQSATTLVDLRGARWAPLEQEQGTRIREMLDNTNAESASRKIALDRIERASNSGLAPPLLQSCLIDPEVRPRLKCDRQ